MTVFIGSCTIIGGFNVYEDSPITPPVNLGEGFAGGYYAGIISTTANEQPTHFLIVSSKSLGETTTSYDNGLSANTTATSLIDGYANSLWLANTNYPAANFCRSLNINGFTDWYLPSFYEMSVIYNNLKVLEFNNNTSTGTNSYSVLTRTNNYSQYVPNQTYSTNFKLGGSEAFTSTSYWVSTQRDSTTAFSISMGSGLHGFSNKNTNTLRVRAIRKVPFYYAYQGNSFGPYRLWRWFISSITDITNNNNCVVSEFKFQVNGIDYDIGNISVSSVNGSNIAGSNATQLIDNNLNYKMENTNHGSNGYTDIIFDFGTAKSFTGYRWATGYSTNMDPKTWLIQAGSDGVNWTTIQSIVNFIPTSSRDTWQGPFQF
ncbi:MAG: DUF1566 domain-containing protein [Synechococcaceae bacterium WB8_1B_057]|nr:DUF1566 domain-containing protein [Synechococcaceae bacterium WB6_1A_059]NDG79914.1 DUF1566 domain-containing protein [Synechococcaceae bacterium WB8_1B_057]